MTSSAARSAWPCLLSVERYLSSLRKQSVALLAALQTVFTDHPLYPAFD